MKQNEKWNEKDEEMGGSNRKCAENVSVVFENIE